MLNDIIFRELANTDEAAFYRALGNWKDEKMQFFAGCGDYLPGMDYKEYLIVLANTRNGINLQEGYVPASFYCAIHKGEIVGRLSLRHKLTDFLLTIGGHIGYGVMPNFRQQGIATYMLQQGIIKAKELGIPKILVTCDDDNIGSFKTIERCGGVLENVVPNPKGNIPKRRYWIEAN